MALSGFLADTIDFRLTFVVFAVLNFVALPLIPLVFKSKVQPKKAFV